MLSESLIESLKAKRSFIRDFSKTHIVCRLYDKLVENAQAFSSVPLKIFQCDQESNVKEEFDDLFIPKDHPIRSHDYGFYISDQTLLATHPTRYLRHSLLDYINDPLSQEGYILPAQCFVRYGIGKKRTITPHKLDFWWLQSKKSFKEIINPQAFVRQIFTSLLNPGAIRLKPTSHPYTQRGFVVEYHDDITYSLAQGGYIHPRLLQACGINPDEYSGIGLGIGLERLAMAKKKIPDIRLLYSRERQTVEQMQTEGIYQPTNIQDPIKIQFKIAEQSKRDLHDKLLQSLGSYYHHLESVHVMPETQEVELIFSCSDNIIERDSIHQRLNFLYIESR